MASFTDKRKFFSAAFSLCVILVLCGGMVFASSDKDERGSGNCDPEKCEKYSDYLVDVKQYKRGGESFHRKYRPELLCLAAAVIEEQDAPLVKKSVGFYHDKKSGTRSPYYIGFDLSAEFDGSLDYGRFCTKLIKENVGGIAGEAGSFDRVLEDSEVAGLAITFRWVWENAECNVTIWLNERDIREFNSEKITAGELYQRSTITNSSGEVILLPI